jgi:hypothetical protein
MRDIEQIKIDLTLKILRGELDSYADIKNLPINDDLRTFICSISPYCAYYYAKYVDKFPFDETRSAAYKNPWWRRYYISSFGEPLIWRINE